jgi:hypothetical protein
MIFKIIYPLCLFSCLLISNSDQQKEIFNSDAPFEIISFKYSLNEMSSGDTTECNNWKISYNQLLEVIRKSQIITGEEWHNNFLVYPCCYEGQLVQNSDTLKFSLNAGGWLRITGNDTSAIMGDYAPEHQPFFVSGPHGK